MSDKLNLDRAITEAVKDAETNSASVEVDTEKVEAALTHTADSWSATAFVRRLWKGRGVTAGGKVTKTW